MAAQWANYQRQLTLLGVGGACSYILFKIYSKYLLESEMATEWTSLVSAYLTDAAAIEDRKERKKFSDDFIVMVFKDFVVRHGVSGQLFVHNLLGFPPDNEIGRLTLEMMVECNGGAYDMLVDTVEDITRNKQSVRILELGPGAGLGIEKMMQRFGDRVECIHGFEVSECSQRMLTEKFKSEIDANLMEFHLVDIGDPQDAVLRGDAIGTYDVIVHMNCFYFWDNLPLCGKKLRMFLKDDGHVVGGFFWRMLPKNRSVFKNTQPSLYLNMFERTVGFEMNEIKTVDIADDARSFQVIAVPACP